MNKKNKKKKGFTLIELIVVIAILGILAAVLIPRFSGFQNKAHRTQIVTDAKQVATAIDSLIAESSTGALTAQTGLTAASTTDKVISLSGISGTFTLDYEADGGFTLKETLGGIDYTATRAAAGGAASVTP